MRVFFALMATMAIFAVVWGLTELLLAGLAYLVVASGYGYGLMAIVQECAEYFGAPGLGAFVALSSRPRAFRDVSSGLLLSSFLSIAITLGLVVVAIMVLAAKSGQLSAWAPVRMVGLIVAVALGAVMGHKTRHARDC